MRTHLTDEHADEWDRFSWFGFRKVLMRLGDDGICELGEMASVALTNPEYVIGDVEALLIRAMGLANIRQMSFHLADEWTQIKLLETDKYMDKVS